MDAPIGLSEEAAELLREVLQHWRRSGPWTSRTATTGHSIRPAEPTYMHNDSGETIPAYACCQVTGTIEISGQNYLLVDKPADTTGAAGWYVFNGHNAIADNEEGKWQQGSVVRAFKNSGTVTAGASWGPTAGQWYVSSGTGDFVATGADDIATDVLKLFTGSGGGSSARLFLTPVGGIAARSGTTAGSATCTEYKLVGATLTTNTATQTVYNPWPVAIPANFYVTASKESVTNQWVAQFPGVVDVNWTSPNLRQSWDGTNYSTIDTATACP